MQRSFITCDQDSEPPGACKKAASAPRVKSSLALRPGSSWALLIASWTEHALSHPTCPPRFTAKTTRWLVSFCVVQVVIVGNGGVGKSSMIQRYCRGTFTKDYKKTIGVDFLERQIEWVRRFGCSVGVRVLFLDVWQTSLGAAYKQNTKTKVRYNSKLTFRAILQQRLCSGSFSLKFGSYVTDSYDVGKFMASRTKKFYSLCQILYKTPPQLEFQTLQTHRITSLFNNT